MTEDLSRVAVNDRSTMSAQREHSAGEEVAAALDGDRAAARRLWQREQARLSALAWQTLGDCARPHRDARRALAILVARRSEMVPASERTMPRLLDAVRAIMRENRAEDADDIDDAYLEEAIADDEVDGTSSTPGSELPAPPPPIVTRGSETASERRADYKESQADRSAHRAPRQQTPLSGHLPQLGTIGLFAFLLGLTVSAMVLMPAPLEPPGGADPEVARAVVPVQSGPIVSPAAAPPAAAPTLVRLEAHEPPLRPFRLPPPDEDLMPTGVADPVEHALSIEKEPTVEHAASVHEQGEPVPGRATDVNSPAAPLGQRVGDEARVFIHYPNGNAAALARAQRIAQRIASDGYEVAEVRGVDIDIETPSVRYFFDAEAEVGRDLREVLASDALDFHTDEVRLLDLRSFEPRPRAGTLEVWLPTS